MPKRWEDYKKFRTNHGLEIVGSLGLFRDLWTLHDEIKEAGAKRGTQSVKSVGATRAFTTGWRAVRTPLR